MEEGWQRFLPVSGRRRVPEGLEEVATAAPAVLRLKNSQTLGWTRKTKISRQRAWKGAIELRTRSIQPGLQLPQRYLL